VASKPSSTFKLGLFAVNAWGGLTKTLAPERWDSTWENNVAAARLAEEARLDFLLPFGIWSSFGGKSPVDGHALEVLTWAAGILQATERITVFGTVHAPFVNPVMAAKQCVTCDRIGGGRFGLNVVSGFNQADFELFGVEMLDHDARYDYTTEWLTIVKRLWTESEPFDFKGRFFDLKGLNGNPLPVGKPKIISAGSSPRGRQFAAEHADFLFMYLIDLETVAEATAAARAVQGGRDIGLFASCTVMCRPTSADADEYYRHVVTENGDWAVADAWEEAIRGSESIPAEWVPMLREKVVSSQSIPVIKGSPDEVAAAFKKLSDDGLDGTAFTMVNYLDDLPIIRDEVIPRLERLGIRVPGTGLVEGVGGNVP